MQRMAESQRALRRAEKLRALALEKTSLAPSKKSLARQRAMPAGMELFLAVSLTPRTLAPSRPQEEATLSYS